MRPRSIALLGFGTVGQAVARILCSRRHRELRLATIFNRDVARKRVDWVPADVRWTDKIEDVLASEVDIVVELVGGREPAHTWIRRALDAGKAVVTANKQVVAEWGPDLLARSARRGAPLRFEAAVAGGIPILHALERGLAGDALTAIGGVLNGTCNYVLSRMETTGVRLEAALADAQALGYAEADPTDDLDGLDARAKLAILAMVALGCRLRPAEISPRSLRGIEPLDFEYVQPAGYTLRQVAWVDRLAESGERVAAAVGPALVARTSLVARIEGNQNLVLVRGVDTGELWFAGPGAGGAPTATAVVSDLLTIARGGGGMRLASCRVAEVRAVTTRSWYVRVRDGAQASSPELAAGLESAGLRAVPLMLPASSAGHRAAAALVEADAPETVAAAVEPLRGAGEGAVLVLPIFGTAGLPTMS